MKKLLLTIAILLFAWPCWGATVYVKETGGSIYYESGAASCDEVTDADTEGDLEAAAKAVTDAGAGGTLNICAGTYTDAELDADHSFEIADTAVTINATGATIISTDAASTVRVGANTTINGGTWQGGAGQIAYILRDSTITFNDCTFSGGTGTYGIYGYADAGNTISTITIDGCTFSGAVEAINFTQGGTGVLHTVVVNDCTFSGSVYGVRTYSVEAACGANDSSPYNIQVTDCIFTDTTKAAIQYQSGIKSTGGTSYIARNGLTTIGNGTNSSVNGMQLQWCRGLIVEDNVITTVENNGAGDGDGIILDFAYEKTDYLSDGCIIRRNKVTDCDSGTNNTSAGINIYYAVDSVVFGNICYANDIGLRLSNDNSTGNVFYNNTCYNNTQMNVRIDDPGNDGAPASTWANNILSTSPYGIYVINNSTEPTINYNCYYNHATQDRWNATGSATFAAGTGAVSSNPHFADAANDDFHIMPLSPCRDAGTDLGDDLLYGLEWLSRWTDLVLTLDQDDYGPGWEIGAYVFSEIPSIGIHRIIDLKLDDLSNKIVQ